MTEQTSRRAKNREDALKDLLHSLFSSVELREHLARESNGDELIRALPEVGVTSAQLVSAAVDALKRRGLVDRDFFDHLEDARPLRNADIREVRRVWLATPKLDRGERWGEDRYELVSRLGRGASGMVWKAIDRKTETQVALKILLEHHADDREVRCRFFRGAQVLSTLSHPGIVKVRSMVGQDGVRFYYVMEYIDGESLLTLTDSRPRPELLEYTFQIGEAVVYLHDHGLLHRDIKPNNILINTRGRAKLIDFDLVTGDGFELMTEYARGTPTYMPPEASVPGRKTEAYDVFSLARTFEHVLRGSGPRISLEVETVLKDATRPAPPERIQTVAHLLERLRSALRAENIRQVPLATPAPPTRAQYGGPAGPGTEHMTTLQRLLLDRLSPRRSSLLMAPAGASERAARPPVVEPPRDDSVVGDRSSAKYTLLEVHPAGLASTPAPSLKAPATSGYPLPGVPVLLGSDARKRATWLDEFEEPRVRDFFALLADIGEITEAEAVRILGGPRQLRMFSLKFKEHAARAPFLVRIESADGLRRYIREGNPT